MEPTFNTRAIILARYDFREHDSRIICYSEDRGKLELVARGAKKLKSKSSGHIEPLTLTRLMVIQGKDVDYAGTAIGEVFYSGIKENLDKIFVASQAMALVDKMTRVGEVDGHEEIFNLLKDFLDELEKAVIPVPSSRDKLHGGIQIFSENFSTILGFSQEDFKELNKNNIQ
jgi:DNA repair protein RecO (recombination protein O)